MDQDFIKELHNANLCLNEDGDFIFSKITKDGKHRTYGPYDFGDAMIICWRLMKYYKNKKK